MRAGDRMQRAPGRRVRGMTSTSRARLGACLTVALLLLAPRGAADELLEPDFGFRMDLPEGWTVREELRTEDSLRLKLLPPNDAVSQLVLSIDPPGVAGLSPEVVRELSFDSLQARDDVTSIERTRPEALGRSGYGLVLDMLSSGIELRVSQVLIDFDGALLLLQPLATRDHFDDWLAECTSVWETLEPVAFSEERARRSTLERLAARCGSELDWAADWEDAAARARASGRPILVWIHQITGFDVSDDALSGAFMDPDIVALVRERFVPLRISPREPAAFTSHEVYGLGPSTFGSAALVVQPDGHVLVDSLVVHDAFLRDALLLADSPPAPVDAELPRAERARALLDRGEFDAARELLASAGTATELRELARLYSRLQQGEQALATIERAVRAPGASAVGPDLVLDRAALLVATGHPEQGAALCDVFLERGADHAGAPKARYLRAMLAWSLEGKSAAAPLLTALVDEQPKSRWAWKAAATLLSTSWAIDRPGPTAWLDAAALDELRPPRYVASDGTPADRARDRALEWLLDHQRADGSWLTPSALDARDGEPPDELQLATVAWCARALARHANDARAAAALQRALDWLLAGTQRARDDGQPAVFMDYAVWSRSSLLELLAEIVRRDPSRREGLAAHAEAAGADLAARVRATGGWSYYVSGSAEASAGVPDVAMSFTTAAVTLALLSADEAGLPVPADLAASGLDALERMRAANGHFTYMRSGAGGGDGLTDTSPEEAAARAPVCTLALLRGGRVEDADLVSALTDFAAHAPGFSAERGKVLMHTGPGAQGSHYLLFDDVHAALALSELPRALRETLTPAVLDELAACRTYDGSHVDNPLIGRAAGTALALLAYDTLLGD